MVRNKISAVLGPCKMAAPLGQEQPGVAVGRCLLPGEVNIEYSVYGPALREQQDSTFNGAALILKDGLTRALVKKGSTLIYVPDAALGRTLAASLQADLKIID